MAVCDLSYPEEAGWANFGQINNETIRLQDVLPYENCSNRPKTSFVWPANFSERTERYSRVKNLVFLGTGHSHPTPTLPSHADLKIAQRSPILHLWVLHKKNRHDVRASWGVDDIEVVYEAEIVWSDEKFTNITTQVGLQIDVTQIPTICKVLKRIYEEGGSSFSSIRAVLGSHAQTKRHLEFLTRLSLINNGPGRPKVPSKPGPSERTVYRLTPQGIKVLALASVFYKDLAELTNSN